MTFLKKHLNAIITICGMIVIIFIIVISQISNNKIVKLNNKLPFDLPNEGTVITYKDTHGGFHNDGELYAVVSFDEEKIDNLKAELENLPISDDHLSALSGKGQTEFDIDNYKKIENGGYLFIDRNESSESSMPLNERASYNFTFVFCDYDALTVTVYMLDT